MSTDGFADDHGEDFVVSNVCGTTKHLLTAFVPANKRISKSYCCVVSRSTCIRFYRRPNSIGETHLHTDFVSLFMCLLEDEIDHLSDLITSHGFSYFERVLVSRCWEFVNMNESNSGDE